MLGKQIIQDLIGDFALPDYFFSRHAKTITLWVSLLRSGQLNTKISDLAPRNLQHYLKIKIQKPGYYKDFKTLKVNVNNPYQSLTLKLFIIIMSEVKKSVLLIDDEVMSNVVNSLMLQRSSEIGQIHCVRNGKEGIEFLENAITLGEPLPDLIYLDLNMPVMNGFEFLKKLQTHSSIDYNSLTVFILSSSIHPTDISKAREIGIAFFFVKPLSEYHIEQSLKLVYDQQK